MDYRGQIVKYTVFYSWQSDSEKSYNWEFIETALNKATENIRTYPHLREHPIVDSGMERIGGSPEVATVMFNKIKDAAIFVGDVSTVGEIVQSGGRGKKKVANPNVMIEMGYAAGTIGWNRIICVMNEKLGRVEKLPIDVRNRRFPIRYKMGEDLIEKAGEIQAGLIDDLQAAIDAIVFCEYEATRQAEKRLDANCIQVIWGFRNDPYFYVLQPGTFTLGSSTGLDTLTINAAIPRLLDLGLIYCDFDSSQNLYAYHWTYLGRMYILSKWADANPR